jgi:hypothetical protein
MSLSLILVFVGLCGGLPEPAASCFCILGPPLTTQAAVREAAQQYDAVFEGVIVTRGYGRRVTQIPAGKIDLDLVVAKVALGQQWRGARQDTVVVRTAVQTTACGMYLEMNARYLLFANQVEGKLYVSKCGPSRKWDEEAERVKRLLGR